LGDRENNTTACQLLGAGAEHRKSPQKTIIIQKKKEKRKAPTTATGPQPDKAESNKRKQQAPNQRERMNTLNYTPRALKRKPETNKQNQ